jgi:hypothetical protein
MSNQCYNRMSGMRIVIIKTSCDDRSIRDPIEYIKLIINFLKKKKSVDYQQIRNSTNDENKLFAILKDFPSILPLF